MESNIEEKYKDSVHSSTLCEQLLGPNLSITKIFKNLTQIFPHHLHFSEIFVILCLILYVILNNLENSFHLMIFCLPIYHQTDFNLSSNGLQSIIKRTSKHHRLKTKTSSNGMHSNYPSDIEIQSLNVSFTRRNSIIYDA